MIRNRTPLCHAWLCLAMLSAALLPLAGAEPDPLPPGVKAVWDLRLAARESTPTRERICLNGLWRWQPADRTAAAVPAGRWGYFKVPGCWPGITDYMQNDCQTVFAHPDWHGIRLGSLSAAWYQREMPIPAEWSGRRVVLQAEYVNSYAAVFIDGRQVGELRFPAGEVDLTEACRPGQSHRLSLLVIALPLKGVLQSFRDTAAASEVKGTVARRGLCGDVYLASLPRQARIADVKVATSVRRGEIALDAALPDLATQSTYVLRARIREASRTLREFASPPFHAGDLPCGRLALAEKWRPDKLWDVHTPQHQYDLELTLCDAGGQTLDAALPVRFGFREFWIDGRDFYLNGTRIYLSALPMDNAQVGAALASYEGARESFARLQSFGINFVYAHNYGCEPGAHLSFAEILRAADDTGMLVAMSQPHFSHYEWNSPAADQTNGYARHAEFYVRAAQNHPSVILYAMSHNATGYSEDMNPDLMDGRDAPRDTWAINNVQKALRAEAIVRGLDPSRLVYHHASGNLGIMHDSNFYPNFVPIQELSDWLEHWAGAGTKPLFFCEYGAPFTWDWTMYRGWYKGQREFGSAKVPWQFCVAEWNAQFLGDPAFQCSDAEKANLRWEARQFRAGSPGWFRWDYPHQVGSASLDERFPILASYLTDNWRAFRTWGLSGNSPWECGAYWKLRSGVDKRRKELPVDWDRLQRPGFSPDYCDQQYERMDLAFARADWIPTAAAQALLRNNRPLLAYLGGKPAAFTSKDHNFLPGETVEKQLILINSSRTSVTAQCAWTLALPRPIASQTTVAVAPGDQVRLPLRFALPAALRPGPGELRATVQFSTGETQQDAFTLHILPPPPRPQVSSRIALFDPQGETRKQLADLGIQFTSVDAAASLAAFDLLLIGKAALSPNGPAPDLARVREGLKVIVFEQTAAALEKRLGFRVAEYGLRSVFPRVPDHPALAGLAPEQWRDWRGAATILPPRLSYETRPRFGPTVQWCGIDVPHLWRCGNRGNVASVLIEKPACGDFLPLLDGGYSLQYSPLMEYREGQGLLLFCQVDVTGRSEREPAAETLVRNLLQYVSAWKPAPARTALYAGAPIGKAHFESAGLALTAYPGGKPSLDQVLIAGPGSGPILARHQAALADFLKAGGTLLAIGLEESDAAPLPVPVRLKPAEHIAAYFAAFGWRSPLAGIGPADVHNRDPRELPLVTSGATLYGNGILAQADNLIVCQLAPWQFDPRKQDNFKRTFRRAAFLVNRLVCNAHVPDPTPLLARFRTPVDPAQPEPRWLHGLYLDTPEEWDDPYRFFRW